MKHITVLYVHDVLIVQYHSTCYMWLSAGLDPVNHTKV